MRAGKLRFLIDIEQPTAGAADSYGASADTWSTLASEWASIEDLSGTEGVYAIQVHPEATLKVVIRYRDDVALNYRIKHGTRYLYIVALQRDSRESEYLTLMCKEEV